MGEQTAIEWCHHTFNAWIGCTKVSPGCKNCYAAALDHRWGNDRWGVGKPRGHTAAAYWRQPLKWNADALKAGERRRVFTNSMADVFDAEVPPMWRLELFDLIRRTPQLDWLLLTKRPERILAGIGEAGCVVRSDNAAFDETLVWLSNWLCWDAPPNVWLGTTVEDQPRASRLHFLSDVPAAVRFLSCEPLLERVNLHLAYDDVRIHWVIAGGESGTGARPMHPDWARSVRDQCEAMRVPFLFKQWGTFNAAGERVGKKLSGRLLDGVLHDAYPNDVADAAREAGF
ncbi:MAG: phage Gp37/Gp68 family protein [Pseudomonadales bacterium]|nr:phage Gp37/Gp68 family protein [Pseudomonadales bacterium]